MTYKRASISLRNNVSMGVSKVSQVKGLPKVRTLRLSSSNSLSWVISIFLSLCLAHASVDKKRVLESCDITHVRQKG